LTYREGGISDEYPFLLGHEAAGIAEQAGKGVGTVEPGDFVVLNCRAVCGSANNIETLGKNELGDYLGALTDSTMAGINAALAIAVGLPPQPRQA
jgi:Zn-dependent alcohol dehydrogenase